LAQASFSSVVMQGLSKMRTFLGNTHSNDSSVFTTTTVRRRRRRALPNLFTVECESASDSPWVFCQQLQQLLGRNTGTVTTCERAITWEESATMTCVQMSTTSRLVSISGLRRHVEVLAARLAPLTCPTHTSWGEASLPATWSHRAVAASSNTGCQNGSGGLFGRLLHILGV